MEGPKSVRNSRKTGMNEGQYIPLKNSLVKEQNKVNEDNGQRKKSHKIVCMIPFYSLNDTVSVLIKVSLS